MEQQKTIYILDSYGLIYRSYYAFISRPLVNSKNENVSAVFGFFRNLFNIVKDYNPPCLVAAFDSRVPTFRHEMYAEYKANRDKTPDDLHAQIPVIEDLLQSFGVPILRKDGFEADDVIATVAAYCEKNKIDCRILSADKDLMQLVTDSTKMMSPDKNGGWATVDKSGVLEKWGVSPESMLDLLSLIGDTADNIPGVKGVGEKTAIKLITEHGSLDKIFENVDSIKGAMGEKLKTGKESAYFSRELVKLKNDVELEIDLEKFSTNNLNFANIGEKLKRHGVPSVAKSYLEIAVEKHQSTTAEDSYEGMELFQNPADLESKTSANAENTKADTANGLANASLTSANANFASPVKNEGDYSGITDLQSLQKVIDEAISAGVVGFDTETNGLNLQECLLAGFSLCSVAKKSYYVPIRVTDMLLAGEMLDESVALNELLRLFTAENVTVVLHNAKFDLQVLKAAGLDVVHTVEFGGIRKAKIFDTMIAAWVLNPDKVEGSGKTSFSLEKLAESKLGLIGTEFSSIVAKNQTFLDIPLETAIPYGAEDADFTLQLWQVFSKLIKEQNLESLFDLEMKVLPILTQMEINGINLDKAQLLNYKTELTEKIAATEKDIYSLCGKEFNIASPKQLGTVLFEDLGLPHGKKTKSGYSTDTSVLEELLSVHPVAAKILEYRGMTKLLSTYVETLPLLTDKNARIHTTYFQTGTATGRLSSRDPNLQNIPVRDEAGRKIRKAFVAPSGKALVSADYSQIELVVLAHLSNDEALCKAFNEGTDVHKATAALIYNTTVENVTSEMRRTAKTINFGVIYGMSAFRLAQDLGISRSDANKFLEIYFSTYSGITTFLDETIKKAEQTGAVETLLGRRRYIYGINSSNKLEKSGAERVAKNSPIQGSAADIVKMAMISVFSELQKTVPSAKLLLQVHDELIVECDEADTETVATLLKTTMENVIKLNVPLKVSVESGNCWGEFH